MIVQVVFLRPFWKFTEDLYKDKIVGNLETISYIRAQDAIVHYCECLGHRTQARMHMNLLYSMEK